MSKVMLAWLPLYHLAWVATVVNGYAWKARHDLAQERGPNQQEIDINVRAQTTYPPLHPQFACVLQSTP